MKRIIYVLIASLSLGADATDATGPNMVYIQQLGSSNTVIVEQVGGTNQVGGVTNTTTPSVDSLGITSLTPAAPSSINYGTISGSSDNVTIYQHGNVNNDQYNIQGSHNTYLSTITGDSNKTNLTIGDQNNASNNYNNETETILGNTNIIISNIIGSQNNSTTSISGNSNQITQIQTTFNGSINNLVTGDNNVFNTQQNDAAGANGHSLVINTNGNYNSISTQQQGLNDSTANINTVGSNNTVTVRSSSNTVVNPATAISR